MKLPWFIGASLVALLGGVVLADGPVHSIITDFERNNCWPEPFVRTDRATVWAPFSVMVANGWRKQNLLAEHHFDGTGAELNEAGKRKVQWILTEAPEQHRTIFVRRAESPEKTAARIAAVQQAAAGTLPAGLLPMIVETTVSPAGWPADRVDIIGRKFTASMPDPKLGKVESSSTSSSFNPLGGASSGGGTK